MPGWKFNSFPNNLPLTQLGSQLIHTYEEMRYLIKTLHWNWCSRETKVPLLKYSREEFWEEIELPPCPSLRQFHTCHGQPCLLYFVLLNRSTYCIWLFYEKITRGEQLVVTRWPIRLCELCFVDNWSKEFVGTGYFTSMDTYVMRIFKKNWAGGPKLIFMWLKEASKQSQQCTYPMRIK